MKRLFDFVASLIGLLLLSPIFLIVAVLIRLQDGGSALFVQKRMGLGGRPFKLFKFRSMSVNSSGPQITVGGDRRITPLGRLLRASKMDELPQLLNVLFGQMSLVGPRPEVEKYTSLYTVEQARVLTLKPGITDPASFAFFDESSLLAGVADPERFYRDHLMTEKIRINLEYAKRASFLTDLLLILATIGKGVGIHVDVFRLLKLNPPRASS